MHFVRRNSTGLKVEIAFGCFVALLVGVGWLGLSRMGQINSNVNGILNQGVVQLQLADQALFSANSNFRMVTTLILMKHRSQKDLDAYVLKREENRAQIALIKKQVGE